MRAQTRILLSFLELSSFSGLVSRGRLDKDIKGESPCIVGLKSLRPQRRSCLCSQEVSLVMAFRVCFVVFACVVRCWRWCDVIDAATCVKVYSSKRSQS